ncbi:plastocyanin/azurin family copper-binding protein [Rhodophyticola porphyridii]|uniref:cupredoxin domain-containing protein n=1 Tax=Rhodophyticola porphyridii TaxID=1852017 RepID=UPI0035D04AD5
MAHPLWHEPVARAEPFLLRCHHREAESDDSCTNADRKPSKWNVEMKTTNMLTPLLAAGILAISSAIALADPGHGLPGEPGTAENVDRTIEIDMTEMAFDPDVIEVQEGETIRFVVTNSGRFVHEFNLGTRETWRSHADEMRQMMQSGMMTTREIRHDRMREADMMHEDPNSVLLTPGDTGEVIWTFSGSGEIGFGCNVPGHLEAGMVGDIEIQG